MYFNQAKLIDYSKHTLKLLVHKINCSQWILIIQGTMVLRLYIIIYTFVCLFVHVHFLYFLHSFPHPHKLHLLVPLCILLHKIQKMRTVKKLNDEYFMPSLFSILSWVSGIVYVSIIVWIPHKHTFLPWTQLPLEDPTIFSTLSKWPEILSSGNKYPCLLSFHFQTGRNYYC